MTVADRTLPLSLGLAGLAVACVLLACLIGTAPLGVGELAAALVGAGDPAHRVIVWEIRLPRALAALLVGVALGASGAALQGLLRNPLAEPGVLGVSAMASLAACVAIYWGLVAQFAPALPLAAIGGALVATVLLVLAAARARTVVALLLVGVGLSSFAGALMSLLLNFAPTPFSLADMVTWAMGSVANRSLDDIALAAPFLLAGLALLALAAPALAVLGAGEEVAASMGVDVRRMRWLVVAGSGLATGAAVALAGAVGFVGIVAPHLVRPLTGQDPGRALVPSALLGGVILVLADLLVRLVPSDQELKLGVVAALIGAPAFVAIALRHGRREEPS